MERHLLVWFSLHNTLLLVSMSKAATAQIITLSAGRLLVQNAVLLNSTSNMTEATYAHKKLPAISIIIGVLSGIVAIFLLLLTAISYFQDRVELRRAAKVKRCPESPSGQDSALEKFSYDELQFGTRNFTEKLGRRRPSRVYKGVLSDATDVAVKRLTDCPLADFAEDLRRVKKLSHKNLVHLYGYCSDGNHRLVVYEYLANGSLRNHLCSSSRSGLPRKQLSWSTRISIALGIARALAHVHDRYQDDEIMRIHGRVKPDNVLLAENFVPKLANFGFERRTGRCQALILTSDDSTREYFAPEWVTTDPRVSLTPKADVYSFGILLLEIIAGRRIGDLYESPSWEFPAITTGPEDQSGGFIQLLDPELHATVELVQLRGAAQVAYWCIQFQAEKRPTMADVVGYLEGRVEMKLPPTPSSYAVFTPVLQSCISSHEASRCIPGTAGIEILEAR